MQPTYQRNSARQKVTGTFDASTPSEGMTVDGFGQVLDMLRTADRAFRESLLKRIAQKDPQLARKLQAAI